MPHTGLQYFFLHDRRRPNPEDVPRVSESLLRRSRNCIVGSECNNDLLEFIGDRVLNFYTAELVERVKISRAHHTTVARVVSNNDTLGRIASCLRLYRHAEVDVADHDMIHLWNIASTSRPPKVLADLFEAFSGAVYVQYGFRTLKPWLDRIFEPIIAVATSDYLAKATPSAIYGEPPQCSYLALDTSTQERLMNRIELDLGLIRNQGRRGVHCLPPKTKFTFNRRGQLQGEDAERIELATHLINLWICDVAMEMWPQYHLARMKAAHLLSSITRFVTSDRVLAQVASALSLADLYQIPSLNPKTISRIDSRVPPILAPDERAYMFKSTVGWMYRHNPKEAHVWGHALFHRIVKRAHDTLVENPSFRPIVRRDDVAPLHVPEDTKTKEVASASDKPTAALSDMLGSLSLEAKGPEEVQEELKVFDSASGEEPATALSLAMSMLEIAKEYKVEEFESNSSVSAAPVVLKLLHKKPLYAKVKSSEEINGTRTLFTKATEVESLPDGDTSKNKPTVPAPIITVASNSSSHKGSASKWKPIGSVAPPKDASTRAETATCQEAGSVQATSPKVCEAQASEKRPIGTSSTIEPRIPDHPHSSRWRRIGSASPIRSSLPTAGQDPDSGGSNTDLSTAAHPTCDNKENELVEPSEKLPQTTAQRTNNTSRSGTEAVDVGVRVNTHIPGLDNKRKDLLRFKSPLAAGKTSSNPILLPRVVLARAEVHPNTET